MSATVFYKVTGSGNDFVMLDGRNTTLADWPVERIRRICDRRDGIGGDGLVILTPEGPGVVRMVYFNSDGSRAAMCGNAALCSTRLAAALELADPAGMNLATDAGTFPTRCVGEGHLAELNLPDVTLPKEMDLARIAGEVSIHLGVVGVPHLVTVVDDIGAVDVEGRGRTLRFHSDCGPEGANANFVGRTSSSTGTETGADEPGWAIRTYERGVEGETLACGTGTVMAAITLAACGRAELPLRLRSAGGKPLSVAAQLNGKKATGVWLCGEGRVVARGVWTD